MKETELKLTHQYDLLETSILVQERERNRIAADLHDELIGNLVAVKMLNQVDYDQSKLNHLIQKKY